MPVQQDVSDVLIVIPGIAGSVLERNGKEIWAPRPGAALRAIFSRFGSIQDLALDGDDPSAKSLDDGVTATRLMPDLHILPGLDWKIDGYGYLRKELVERLGLTPGDNYFELPYDWRRDNRVAAAALAEKAEGWLGSRRKNGFPDAKLVLVAHSMGGIISRIFLEKMGGWQDTRSLITFGTPYSGSVNALEFLANGFKKGWGPATIDLTDTLRSFTSVYQLLPSYRCLATDDGPAYLDDLDNVPGLDHAMMTNAMTLHRSIRTAVDHNRESDYGGSGGYDIRPVIGDFQATKSSARVVANRVDVSVLRHGADERGDGTVPKISAIPHEFLTTWHNASFRQEKHASLQADDAVIDQVCSIVSNIEIDTNDVFPAKSNPVALQTEDVLIGEPVEVIAQPRDPGFTVAAAVTHIATGTSVADGPMTQDPSGSSRHSITLTNLPSGDYRVEVGGVAVSPTTDFFSVIDPDERPED